MPTGPCGQDCRQNHVEGPALRRRPSDARRLDMDADVNYSHVVLCSPMIFGHLTVGLAIVLSVYSTMAADIESAKDAYRRGDDVLASHRYRQLAEQGDPEAQYLLGKMYHYGQGVDRDYSAAVKWYRAGADQGYTKARRNLAVMYARGHGVTRDMDLAVRLFKQASAEGDDSAPMLLGMIHAAGDGVAQDDEEAAKWYRTAADRSNREAQFVLGVFYARGQGVPQGNVQSYMWLNLAALNGAKQAREARDMVAERMTKGEIVEAHRLTREWQPKKGNKPH